VTTTGKRWAEAKRKYPVVQAKKGVAVRLRLVRGIWHGDYLDAAGRRRLRPRTLKGYESQVRRFLDRFKPADLASITRVDIERYKATLENASNATVDRHVAGISSFLAWAVRHGCRQRQQQPKYRRQNQNNHTQCAQSRGTEYGYGRGCSQSNQHAQSPKPVPPYDLGPHHPGVTFDDSDQDFASRANQRSLTHGRRCDYFACVGQTDKKTRLCQALGFDCPDCRFYGAGRFAFDSPQCAGTPQPAGLLHDGARQHDEPRQQHGTGRSSSC